MTQRVKQRYKAQRSRGTQGFGYYIPALNRLTHNPNEDRLLNNLLRQNASEVLFHHRMPTSTANVQNACHPFSTKWDQFKHNYVMVHNGYLSNDEELRAEHEKLGIRYVSEQADGRFNDSEALLYDLALYLEGYQDELKAEGAIAFVMVERDADGNPINLHYGRNTSPLQRQHKPNKFLLLASEGKGETVEPHMWHTYDYATGETSMTEIEIPTYRWSASALSFTPQIPTSAYNYGQYDGGDYDFTYWTTEGDHYVQSTAHGSKPRLCHLAGEPCGRTKLGLFDHTDTERRISHELAKAEWDAEMAADNVDIELISLNMQYEKLKAELGEFDERSEAQANAFLSVADEMDALDLEIKTLEKVYRYLRAQADYEANVMCPVPPRE